MKINVIGCGRLGAPYAAGLALMGHTVFGLDTDPKIIQELSAGRAPFDEPGLADAIAFHTKSGDLRFTSSYDDAADFANLHILCIGTPQRSDGLATDLSDLETAVANLTSSLRGDAQHVIVVKSSVPAGTTVHLTDLARTKAGPNVQVTFAYSPDFLRESTSLADMAAPSRIVLGLAAGDEYAEKVLREAWKPQTDAGSTLVITDLATAELCKTAANSFLAMKISFINAMASLCEATNGDVTALAATLALDPRIGPDFLQAGIGYGGSCLPKDVRSLIAQGREHGVGPDLALLVQVDTINTRRQRRVVELARQACGGSLLGRRVGVWGLSFKPGIDDLRDSPALAVALAIQKEGGQVTAYDPAAMRFAEQLHPQLSYAKDPAGAAEGSEVLLHLTAWPEFADVAPDDLALVTTTPMIIDGRAALDPIRWISAGWTFQALGHAL